MTLPNLRLQQIIKKAPDMPESHMPSTNKQDPTSEYDSDLPMLESNSPTHHLTGKSMTGVIKLPLIDLSHETIDPKVLMLLPERIARARKVVPFAADSKTLRVAASDTSGIGVSELLAKKTGLKVTVYRATAEAIDNALLLYGKNLQTVIDSLIERELGTTSNLTNDLPIIKIINTIITAAYREKASDIHIEAEENAVLVRFRIDGNLYDALVLEKSLHSSLITRIKVLANLRIDEHLDAQDGKIRMDVDDDALDIRVSVIPTTEGEKVVLRLLSRKFRSFSLTDLGMSTQDLTKVEQALQNTYGMILSTGPTGSGKTTSIYSLIKILNTREKNITTIEDPVEYHIKGVNHIPVNNRTGFTFASGLRAMLRQDPNVIFVGEIRDNETAGLAVNAALTGHLVVTTLHTNDAGTALPRLIDLAVEPFLLSSTVNLIIAQRLVRKICPQCKTKQTLKRSELAKLLPAPMVRRYLGKKAGLTVYSGGGCSSCRHTGYSGRIGIFEVLEVTEKIRSLIIQKSDAATIQKTAVSEGMTTLFEDGMTKVLSGDTTFAEILRVIKVGSL
jgi:type IV pilus assembly protein PilB